MKIALAAPVLTLDQREINQTRMMEALVRAKDAGADLVLFSEVALSGFESMNFDYRHDIVRALGLNGPELAVFREQASALNIGIGLGFYENEEGGIYDSYLIMDREGRNLHLYRRLSPTWMEAGACADYRVGHDLQPFHFEGKAFATILCGDLWTDNLLTAFSILDDQVDCWLWPVHVDFSLETWQNPSTDRSDPTLCNEYAYCHQASLFAHPVCFVNTYVPNPGRAKGGLYVWQQGQTLAQAPMGRPGLLLFELD